MHSGTHPTGTFGPLQQSHVPGDGSMVAALVGTLAEKPRTQRTAENGHSSAGCAPAPGMSRIETGMLLVIQPLSGKKPLGANGFPYRPSQNTNAFIPQPVLLGGEMLLLHAASWGR